MKWILLIIYSLNGTPSNAWQITDTLQQCRDAWMFAAGAGRAINQPVTNASCVPVTGNGRIDLQ